MGSDQPLNVRSSMARMCPLFRGRMLCVPLLLATLAGAGGCTMCPDPLDYSGPVPNGSTPQNNFWARSNGILPLGASPRPWPPIVQAPTPAAPLPETIAADSAADQSAVEVADEGATVTAEADDASGEGAETQAVSSVLALEPASGPATVR
jgi:hypothetical protein